MTCTVEICDGEATGPRKMCHAHYRRWRLGQPLNVKVARKVKGGSPCSIPTCKRRAAAGGLCTTHIYREKMGLDLHAPVRSYVESDDLEQRLRHYAPEGAPDECWEWTAAINKGYGMIAVANSKLRGAHVVAWEIANGRGVPDGLVVRHGCDNGICTNPAHLEIGTHGDNVNDAWERGRRTVVAAPGFKHRTPDEVAEIRQLHSEGHNFTEIARRTGAARQNVARIVRGATYPNNNRRNSSVFAKLSDGSVRELRGLYAGGDYSQQQLAAKFGIHQTAVSQIVRRKTYTHVD